MQETRDHGGNLDAAIAQYGGTREGWLDLSTGINPVPYPIPEIPLHAWNALPDQGALNALIDAARAFWDVPQQVGILPVAGASAAIAHIPLLKKPGSVSIPGPTYNEHAASFAAAGWHLVEDTQPADASVHVHPNNPDGRIWRASDLGDGLRIIDESFCDVMPDASLMAEATAPDTLILKSFGKFWGLAGVRLGFVMGAPELLERLSAMMGPWSVAGPALHIGRDALQNADWAAQTRSRLSADAATLDNLMAATGAKIVGGTTLFRLYDVGDAAQWQGRLAKHHIWSRIFPYNGHWLRLGLPDALGWARLKSALA